MTECSFYVVFAPQKSTNGRRIIGARATKMVANAPADLPAGGIVVRFTIDVPLEVFAPHEVSAEVKLKPHTVTLAEDPQDATVRLARELSGDS